MTTAGDTMDLALSPEEEELVEALDGLLARESSMSRVRAAEPLGFDPGLWTALQRMGVPALAVGPEAATTVQLVLIAEVAGRHLACAPVIESLVAARLLERCGGPGAAELLDGCSAGRIATLVLHHPHEGRADLVPAGAVAETLLACDGETLTAYEAPAPMAAAPNIGSLALADRHLDPAAGRPLAHGEPARAAFGLALREWRLLTAAQLVGLAARALEIAVAYVKERTVFGRPVGSFQTVAAALADHATAIDGARLLVREAAWACDVRDPRAVSLPSMAFCYAAERAVAVAGDALHFHGGYGFTTEYDVQLYYRRAQAHPLVWGSVRREYRDLAGLLFGPEPARGPA
ncbi:acyl-CoA dehydrogenase family protein [Actinocorallia longicatena]|uniref:Acyl-CoA dehydrogenase family protein n=1 Tax=Actinocorallia longicatena TaxID=111803 RepID=A0ABP6QDI4_9ACTN